ncbi:MAG: glycosyltransferase family 4 protein, partial [Acidobacteria bacterium]|nr:glycosyltransferase family 4 protein [Acidobacteriota bacterium]
RAYVEKAGLAQLRLVLVPGGLHFRKNAELILHAWPAIQEADPDLRLVIINHSDPAYASRAANLGSRVHVLGFVPDDALRALYSAAQVVWFPSRYEGFGLPVLEAMACGTPVVTVRASSLPEIAGTAACLVAPDRPSAHVEAIRALLADDALRQELSARGRTRAALFTWTRAAAELKNHFDSLL